MRFLASSFERENDENICCRLNHEWLKQMNPKFRRSETQRSVTADGFAVTMFDRKIFIIRCCFNTHNLAESQATFHVNVCHTNIIGEGKTPVEYRKMN